MVDVHKFTEMMNNRGLMEKKTTEEMKSKKTENDLTERLGWNHRDIKQIVRNGSKGGSSYVWVPKTKLEAKDIKAAGMNYLVNTCWEYDYIRKNLENCAPLGQCSFGKLNISFYVHESCKRVFTIIQGFKGAKTSVAMDLLETMIEDSCSFPVTNVGTAGYLGNQKSMPHIFILENEEVFLPITGDGNPHTLCSFSESLDNERKTRVSYDPPRFLNKKNNSTPDIINDQDRKFNKAIREVCGALGFEVVAGPLFTSITKLELMSSQKELLTSSKFLGADMETSILRKSGRPVNMVRAFADRCEEGQSTREELKKKKMIDREEAIKKLSKIISRLEK